MFTDDPVKDALRRDREEQAWLDRLPRCAHCHQPIQDENYFEIEEVNVCSDCLYEYCEEQYKKTNTELEN
jgi:recombinational DNA repair protein (RecF pathway)